MRERLYVTESRPEGRYYKEEFDPPSHYSSFSGALGPQMVGDKPSEDPEHRRNSSNGRWVKFFFIQNYINT